MSPRWIDRVSWSEKTVFVSLSRETIKQSPEYTDDALLSREYETQLHGHYNRLGYWIDEQRHVRNRLMQREPHEEQNSNNA